METAFEDWVEQRQMDYNQPLAESSAVEVGGAVAENGNGEDDIRWETVEGDAELRVELNDTEDTLEDGTTVRRQTITRHRVCPVTELLTINGVVTERRRGTDRLLDVSIEEDVLVLPPGVEDPAFSDDLQTTTDVEDVEESLDDGTPVYRRITTTTIVPAVPLDDQSTGLEFEPPPVEEFKRPMEQVDREMEFADYELSEPATDLEITGGFSEPVEIAADQFVGVCDVMDIERRAEQVVAESVEAALQQVWSSSAGWSLSPVD